MAVAGEAVDLHRGFAELGEADDGYLAAFYEHIETDDHESDHCKGDGEDREGGEEFAEEIELGSSDDGEEGP